MSEPIALDDLIRAIQRQFHKGPPNGWLLGWADVRHFALVGAAAAPHKIINNTSFDYGYCNWYDILIKPDGSRRYWTLTVKLSFITPAYCLYWTQYETPTQGAVIATAPNGYRGVEDRVRVALQKEGFFELPDDWYDYKIEGVHLELSGSENVTLSKCLFSDYAE